MQRRERCEFYENNLGIGRRNTQPKNTVNENALHLLHLTGRRCEMHFQFHLPDITRLITHSPRQNSTSFGKEVVWKSKDT